MTILSNSYKKIDFNKVVCCYGVVCWLILCSLAIIAITINWMISTVARHNLIDFLLLHWATAAAAAAGVELKLKLDAKIAGDKFGVGVFLSKVVCDDM